MNKISLKSIFKKKPKIKGGSTVGIPWRYFLISIAGVLFIVFLGTLKFIYTKLSASYQSTQKIELLRSEVVPEIYDIKKFDQVIESLDKKKNPATIDWQNVKNPFLKPGQDQNDFSGAPQPQDLLQVR